MSLRSDQPQEKGDSLGAFTIGIRIIKGIDKEHPYRYRVVIGQNERLRSLIIA